MKPQFLRSKAKRIKDDLIVREMSGDMSSAMVLGLDISSVCIGWSLFAFETEALYAYGKILIPSNNLFEAIEFGRAEVLKIIKGEEIVAAGIEELNCFLGGDTTRKLCMMGGGIALALFDVGLHPNFLNTGTIKACMNTSPNKLENRALQKEHGWAKHNYTKQLSVYRVNEALGLNLKCHSNKEKSDDDVADGIAVGKTLLSMLREENTF